MDPAIRTVMASAVICVTAACSTASEAQTSETQVGVTAAVQEILQVDVARIRPSARFQEDLGADSLDCVEIVMAIEERFSITVEDNAVGNLKTVRDAIDYVEARRKATSKRG